MSGDPWAAPTPPPGQPYIGPPYIPPPDPTGPTRSRSLIWIVAVIVVVVLAISGTGFAVIDGRHHDSRSAVAAPATSSRPPTSATSAPASPVPSTSASAPPASASAPASPPPATPTAPGAAAPGAGSGPLDQYLLAPAEVGANAAMYLIDGGRNTTDQATLDWCNFNYTSEKVRVSRVQVEYSGDTTHPAGNELVRYQPGGTAKAYSELQHAVAGCPATSQTDGYIYSLVQRAPHDAALATRQLVLSFQVIDPTGQLDLPWQAIVYQFNGNYFSGVYVYGLTRSAALAVAEQLGALSARHLAQAATGKPGTGGGPFQSLSAPPDTGVQD